MEFLFKLSLFQTIKINNMASDLVIDPQIRGWVFLPIVVITFLVGVIKHYVSMLLTPVKRVEAQLIRDSQMLLRSRLLRENGKYIPKSSFYSRRQYFTNSENGFLAQKRNVINQNFMTDPNFAMDLLRGNVTNVLPMIVIGGWINWMFSGFITTKVPVPLTLRFKPMLQRGIEQMELDSSSWVSSISWYFLNVFGLRSVYDLVLGETNEAYQTMNMQHQMSEEATAMLQDPKLAFKTEWEALKLVQHRWALTNVEQNFLKLVE